MDLLIENDCLPVINILQFTMKDYFLINTIYYLK